MIRLEIILKAVSFQKADQLAVAHQLTLAWKFIQDFISKEATATKTKNGPTQSVNKTVWKDDEGLYNVIADTCKNASYPSTGLAPLLPELYKNWPQSKTEQAFVKIAAESIKDTADRFLDK